MDRTEAGLHLGKSSILQLEEEKSLIDSSEGEKERD